nr:DUF983 domain-containing protein [Thermoanaerobacterales bacterium]
MQDSSVSSGQAPAAPEPLTVGRLLLRGITMRCPVCGGRGLFRRWVHMVRHCPRCGFDLERIEGHWIGALGMNTIVTFGAVLVAVVIGFTVTYSSDSTATLGWAVGAVVAVAVVVPLLFYPVSKTLWSAIDLAMRPLEPDDGVDPRWLPPASRHEQP